MPWKVPAQARASASTAAPSPSTLRGDPLDALGHLCRRPAGKGHQQDAARIGAADHEMRDAVRQRIGLARACARDHQQGRSGN